MGVEFRSTTGAALERPADLVGILTNLNEGDVLFIDEVHRLGKVVEEYLYPAMEDFFIDVVIDSGPGSRALKFELKHFTLIGATTREGLLGSPFRGRFGVLEKLDYYSETDLADIVRRSARILDIEIDAAGTDEIARRARGTPRIANRLLRRIRDVAQVVGDNVITKQIAEQGLGMLGIDSSGLDEMDRKILEVVAQHDGGPVGIKTIAVSVSEEEDAIEGVYEPYLIQRGLLKKTSRGRMLSAAAYVHLGRTPPKALANAEEEGTLFE